MPLTANRISSRGDATPRDRQRCRYMEACHLREMSLLTLRHSSVGDLIRETKKAILCDANQLSSCFRKKKIHQVLAEALGPRASCTLAVMRLHCRWVGGSNSHSTGCHLLHWRQSYACKGVADLYTGATFLPFHQKVSLRLAITDTFLPASSWSRSRENTGSGSVSGLAREEPRPPGECRKTEKLRE